MLFCKTLLFISFSFLAYAQITIDVEIEGFENNKGQVLCALVTEAKDFLQPSAKPTDEQIVLIKDKQAKCQLKLVNEGTYAVSVVHDLDANQKVKMDAFGIALEPWGVSNNAPASSFGPPGFEQAKVDSRVTKKLRIKLNH